MRQREETKSRVNLELACGAHCLFVDAHCLAFALLANLLSYLIVLLLPAALWPAIAGAAETRSHLEVEAFISSTERLSIHLSTPISNQSNQYSLSNLPTRS